MQTRGEMWPPSDGSYACGELFITSGNSYMRATHGWNPVLVENERSKTSYRYYLDTPFL